MSGPLQGVKVVEVGGIGPNPFAGMLLADMGADVIRLDRAPGAGIGQGGIADPTLRSRQSIAADLKSAAGRDLALRLAARADVLIEGFRPGVMERLGLGPDDVWADNPALVYGRITGYGQDGPMAAVPGHDINYIALSGALGASRRTGENPMFACNLVGDYGGGAMFLAFGVLCALLQARTTGVGQVVDAAMVDGAALMMSLIHGLHAQSLWNEQPGTNLLDSGAHFYDTYETSDGQHVAVGSIEPQFYARLLELLEIPAAEMPQFDQPRWPEFKQRLRQLFAAETAAHWQQLFEHDAACVTVVRKPFDAHAHPHLAARQTFIELSGVRQPAAAPRFSRTPAAATPAQTDPAAALARWGIEG